MLEFLENFDVRRRWVYIWGCFYQITLALVASTLQFGNVHPSNDRTCKDLIKEFTTKATIRELRESMCLADQNKWMGKNKDKFQASPLCAGLKYPYKA